MRRLALLIAISLVAAPVAAGPKRGAKPTDVRKRAKAHHARAEKLYALGRFEAALVEYVAAFEAEPLPGFLLNIGQCYRNLDRLDEAIFSYRKYLQLAPAAGDREEIEQLIGTLEAEVEAREEARQAEADRKARDAREAKARADAALATRPRERSTPVYRRWWFITGGVVLTGAAIGATIAVTRDGLPDSDLGVVDFTK